MRLRPNNVFGSALSNHDYFASIKNWECGAGLRLFFVLLRSLLSKAVHKVWPRQECYEAASLISATRTATSR